MQTWWGGRSLGLMEEAVPSVTVVRRDRVSMSARDAERGREKHWKLTLCWFFAVPAQHTSTLIFQDHGIPENRNDHAGVDSA